MIWVVWGGGEIWRIGNWEFLPNASGGRKVFTLLRGYRQY